MKIVKEKVLHFCPVFCIQENYGSFMVDERKIFFKIQQLINTENMTELEKPPFYSLQCNKTI